MSFVDKIVVQTTETEESLGRRHTVTVTDHEGDTVVFTKAFWGVDSGTFLVKIGNERVEVPFRAIKQFLAAFGQI